MTLGRRRAVALVGALVASVAVLVAVPGAGEAAPALVAAPSAGPCADSKGVTVVVDFGELPGGTRVRCAAAPVKSGFDALTKAGFTFEGTVRFPGLLCRIDGKPADDPCQNAPSNERYWAYWYAPRGGEWTYSSSGAGSRTPPPGSVEGWAFGDNAKPSIDPPPPNPTTTTTTTRHRSGTTVPPSPSSTTTAAGGAPTTVAGGPATSTTSPTGAATSTASTDPDPDDPDADSSATTTKSDEVAASADTGGANDDGAGGGSPVGALAAVVVAIGLGGAALWRSRRTRTGTG